ncbi:MAG: ABC transporter permease [Planctomycetes bacterium]|nr:ABC transporter permease [Planctomycetota bacterium]
MLDKIQELGGGITDGLRGVGRVFFLFTDTVKWLFRSLPIFRVLLWQLYFIGVQSIPVIITTGAFTGLVLAYESYFQFQKLGVTSWVGPLVAVSLVSQLGPVLSGLMLAGRVGGAMAAELGTMAVTEQIDALETMGTDPVYYLVLPRVLASTLLAPLLNAFATFVGIAAGFTLTIYGLGVDPHFLFKETFKFLDWYDFLVGIVKAGVFGCVMSLICCYKGINTRGGAEGVGKATTEANVASCITILMLNLFLTMVLMLLDPFGGK